MSLPKALVADKKKSIGSEGIMHYRSKHGLPPKPLSSGPVAYLTSTAFVTESQWVRFIQTVLKRKGVLQAVDSSASACRADLVAKYQAVLSKLKVTYINDASYHRPTAMMVGGRTGTGKVGEGYLGRGPGTWFFWDQGLEDCAGIAPENITMIQLLEKPWLFNRPGRDANYHVQAPNVAELDPADEAEYYAALQLTQDAYDALKQKPPLVGAGQAGGTLPGCPASGRSCANELAEVSTRLNTKYAAALERWCAKYIDGADVIVGQGGEVVMLNMAWQCNQRVASRLVEAVRANRCVYAGLSASTMVAAKSMEMTGEIQPGWLEAFACDAKFLSKAQFDAKDLNADGISANVLGALPLFEAPLAMRPHYSAAWEAQVLQKNVEAEKEFEAETGIEIPDELVRDSNAGCEVGCQLLTLISKHWARGQDRPVFVPIRNGKVIEVLITPSAQGVVEEFHVIP